MTTDVRHLGDEEFEARLTDVERAVLALPDRQRFLIATVYDAEGGSSYEEAAEIMDMPLEMTKREIAEARLAIIGRVGRRPVAFAPHLAPQSEFMMQLVAYVDGELDDDSITDVRYWLERDAAAAAWVRELAGTKDELDHLLDWTEEADPAINSKTMVEVLPLLERVDQGVPRSVPPTPGKGWGK